KDASKIRTENGKYITDDFIKLTLHYIMVELVNIQLKYQQEYGEMILLFDDWSKDYWRRDVYAGYKSHRKKVRDESLINYHEVYNYTNDLVNQLETNTPWRCITVTRAEADDTILVLSREFCQNEKILIYSPDKDFIQAQRWNNTVKQYSPLTKKWLKPTDKYDSAEHWQLEHIMLGDDSDGVPKIVDHTEFSDSFKAHLKDYGIKEQTPFDLRESKVDKTEAFSTFKVQKTNRKGEEIGLDVYKNMRFGSSTLAKAIEKAGTLDKFLDSQPLYREHYERNFTLVMEEGIPEYIWKNTMMEYNDVPTQYNIDEFDEYLDSLSLHQVKAELIKVFKATETLDISNCGW
ncbi:MAG: hypothetical protein KAI79_01340, partial [Bacteroidales bacterium]|nr:hypothetical protein [Bacteroidales bacterium]